MCTCGILLHVYICIVHGCMYIISVRDCTVYMCMCHTIIRVLCFLCTCTYLYAGLDVKKVAHDFQPQIRKYLENDLHCLNSFDTWHGTCIQYAVVSPN